MTSAFFSNENFELIYNNINNNIERKYGFSIPKNNTYSTKILDIMKTIYASKRQLNISQNLNKHDTLNILIKKSIQYFMIYFEKNINSSETESPLTQKEMTQDGINNNAIQSYEVNNMTGYHSLKYDILDQNIETVYPLNNPANTITGVNEKDYGVNSTTSEIKRPINNTHPENPPNRINQTLKQILLENQSKLVTLENNLKQNNSLTTVSDMKQLFYALKDGANFKVKSINLVIDTGDSPKSCSGETVSPFDVKVSFGTSVPKKSNGVVFSSGYNNSQPSCSNLYVSDEIKNVHSIRLDRIVIPEVHLSGARYPFLYLCIEEFESNVITTGNIKNIFAKMYIDSNTRHCTGCSNDCSGFLHYVNQENDIKIFKTPLSTLSKLSIKLITPVGTNLCNNWTFNTYDCNNSSDNYLDTYVQYMFQINTLENYVPEINVSPFNNS